MAYTVTQEDIFSLSADAAVLCIENTMIVTDAPICRQLAAAGDDRFGVAMRKKRFIPVGSAAAADYSIPPFRHIILTGTPKWENTHGNEILILHRCYQNIFRVANDLGCKSVATPFLSTYYYGFQKEDAIRTAYAEARKTDLDVIFITDTEELYALSQKTMPKPARNSPSDCVGINMVFST